MLTMAINIRLITGLYQVLSCLGMIYNLYTKFVARCLGTIQKLWMCTTAVTYMELPLSQVSKRRLQMVGRKTLVLDMDKTMMTSVLMPGNADLANLPIIPYDFALHLSEPHCSFYIYKRPYLDLFLEHAFKWYNLVVFTTAVQPYASPVLDYLENGRNLFQRRYYRQHCIEMCGIRGKLLSTVHLDLANGLILDDSKVVCSLNAGNSLHITSYRIGSKDEALLCLLPFLDALRFTRDVRSVLGRCTNLASLPFISGNLDDRQQLDGDPQ